LMLRRFLAMVLNCVAAEVDGVGSARPFLMADDSTCSI